MTGRIAVVYPDRFYGFIGPDNSKTEIFFHATALKTKVEKGDRVEFSIGTYRGRTVAENVRIIPAATL